MGFGLDVAIYLTFTRRSHNYSLHNLTSHKLQTLSYLSCILSPAFILVIPSPAVLCLSKVSQYLSPSVIPCSVLYSFCTGPRSVLHCFLADKSPLQPFSNPLKVALGVPSRGHSVEQFIFPAVLQTSLPLLREQTFT
jgi:hypothetical protein